MKQYALNAAGLTDQGVKRDHNEDAWSAPPSGLTAEQLATQGQLYVVADGVGGHQAGDVASAMAVEIIQQSYYDAPASDVISNLTDAIRAAHQAISSEAAAKPERYGMGSTVTAAVLRGDVLTVANVGDSRTYLVRGGQAHQVTVDHTWVEEQVQIGLISRQDAARHPQRNIITRSLGGNQELQIDLFEEQLVPGDRVLLCSDGLSNMIPASELGAIASRGKNAPAIVHQLVELAKERGAPDNVTAVLIKVAQEQRSLARRLFRAGAGVGLALVVGVLAWWLLVGTGQDAQPAAPLPTRTPAPPSATPAPTLAPDTPTPLPTPSATVLPLDTAIPPPVLSRPLEDELLVAGEAILFTWQWEAELGNGADWRFVFSLRPDQALEPLVREELPLNQRGYGLSQPLPPGAYWWALAVVGNNRRGETAERRLMVVEPTLAPR